MGLKPTLDVDVVGDAVLSGPAPTSRHRLAKFRQRASAQALFILLCDPPRRIAGWRTPLQEPRLLGVASVPHNAITWALCGLDGLLLPRQAHPSVAGESIRAFRTQFAFFALAARFSGARRSASDDQSDDQKPATQDRDVASVLGRSRTRRPARHRVNAPIGRAGPDPLRSTHRPSLEQLSTRPRAHRSPQPHRSESSAPSSQHPRPRRTSSSRR